MLPESSPSPAADRARALVEAAAEHLAERRLEAALAGYDEARAAWREAGDLAGEAAAVEGMARVRLALGDTDTAIALYDEAAALYRAVGETASEATCRLQVAHGQAVAGQLAAGLESCEQAIQLFRQVEQADGIAAAESRASRILWRLGRREAAADALARAVAVLEAAGATETTAGETPAFLRQQLASVRAGVFPEATRGAILPAEEVEAFIQNTVAVMTVAEEQRDAWRANVVKARDDALARGGAWRVEKDLFEAALELLDGGEPRLPRDHPYLPALAAIRTGIASGGPQEFPVAREIIEAVRQFVGTEDWPAARRLVEEKPDILLRPEVDAVFDRNIEAAMASGDARGARVLMLHRDVLRACRDEGIDAGFAWLSRQIAEADARASAAEAEDALPPDFVPRCVAALLGTAAERLALFSYLQGLGRFDPRLQPLTDAVQRAALDGDMAGYGRHLDPGHAAVWRRIRAAVSRGDRPGRDDEEP